MATLFMQYQNIKLKNSEVQDLVFLHSNLYRYIFLSSNKVWKKSCCDFEMLCFSRSKFNWVIYWIISDLIFSSYLDSIPVFLVKERRIRRRLKKRRKLMIKGTVKVKHLKWKRRRRNSWKLKMIVISTLKSHLRGTKIFSKWTCRGFLLKQNRWASRIGLKMQDCNFFFTWVQICCSTISPQESIFWNSIHHFSQTLIFEKSSFFPINF